MSDANLILAHDLGTSGNKATLYSSAGERLGSVTESYPTHFFNGCWAEQEPDDWWRAVCASTRQLLAETKVDPADVAVVALSGQMMGCTPVDAAGRALRPSMLYCDQRATTEADALLARLPLERFYRIVGHRVSASYTLEKFMWLRDATTTNPSTASSLRRSGRGCASVSIFSTEGNSSPQGTFSLRAPTPSQEK